MLRERGRFDEAIGRLERALEVKTRHPGFERDAATTLAAIGTVHERGARDCYERALRIEERVLPDDHPELVGDAPPARGAPRDARAVTLTTAMTRPDAEALERAIRSALPAARPRASRTWSGASVAKGG